MSLSNVSHGILDENCAIHGLNGLRGKGFAAIRVGVAVVHTGAGKAPPRYYISVLLCVTYNQTR